MIIIYANAFYIPVNIATLERWELYKNIYVKWGIENQGTHKLHNRAQQR